MQGKARKLVSLIAALALTITCAISGFVLPIVAEGAETVATNLMPNGDFEQSEVSGWTYSDKSAVPILTDAKDGNKYIQIPANGALITGPKTNCTVAADDLIRVSFKVRKTMVGKLRFIVRLYNAVDGYAQPDWVIASSATAVSGNNEWFKYTVYLEADKATSNFYLMFGELSANSTADVTLDLDEIEVEMLTGKTLYDVNLFSDGDFEDGNIASINDYAFGGLFNDGGVIEVDSTDSTNHVLHLTKNAQAYFYPDVQVINKKSTRLVTGDYYRLTYRMKGTGTTAPGINASNGGTRVALSGDPGVASAEWKTITAYYLINPSASLNTNYGFDFKTTGEVYIDDMQLTRLRTATDFSLAAEAMTLTAGETATVELATTPEGAYVPSLTWTSSNTAVATVKDGVITAVAEGETTVTLTNGTKTLSIAVTVNKVMASELVLNKQAITMAPYTTETLTLSALPNGGWFDTPVWTSSDESVITVSNGTVTAVGPGTATVGVQAGDLSTSCAVTVQKNLLTGGDFEASDTAGVGSFANVKSTSTNWYIAPGKGYGGGNALAIDYRKSDRLIKWPTFAPNTTYKISFMAKGPSVFINLWKYAGKLTNWSNPHTYDMNGEWTQYSLEFVVGEEGFYPLAGYENYFMLPNRSATLEDTTAVTYIDNFSIVATDCSDERVLGGDFELTAPQHWSATFFPIGWNVVAESDGNHALYIPETASDPGDKWMRAVRVMPNTEYVVSFKAKGAPIDLYLNPSYITAGGGWKRTAQSNGYMTYAFKVQTGASIDQNYLINITRETSFGGTEGTYIDDFSICPATSDLVVDEMLLPGVVGAVKPGVELLFGAKLTNDGVLPIEGTFPIEFRINGNIWYTMNYTASIAPGETVTVLSDRAWTATEGDHSISVKVNGGMEVVDSSLQNNTAAKTLRVATVSPTLPSYAEDAGFNTLTFADDFNSIDTIDMNATGEYGYKWYVRRPYGASTVTANDLTVENGILTLKLSDPDYNYGIATIDAKTGAGFSFNKGYLEVRFRIPDSSINGEDERGVPAIWSLPPENIIGDKEAWVEMDWMEYWGKGLKYWRYPKGYYTVTMHDHLLNEDGTTDYWYRNSNASQNGLGDEQWHTMGWVWETGKVTAYLDGTKVMSQSYSADSTGSPKPTVNEGTLVNGAFSGMDTLMQILILGGSADSPMEVDYVYIWQNVEEPDDNYLFVDTTVEGGEIDLGSTDVLVPVEGGETLSIDAKPADGYIMKPGSLKYVLSDGTEVKILNQSLTDMTFGGGDGYTFEVEAPKLPAKVTAEFVSVEDTTFAANTIGTSLRETEEGEYDGIRFLTRMNLAATFDPESESLHVKYDGVEYEVVEIGSLLMRYAEGVELGLDNYKWRSRAYVKGRSMALVDYTDSYIDFTVVMTKGENVSTDVFNARKYTARGYIVLKDAEGNEKTVLCDTQLTNSVNGASAALL